MTVVSGWKQRSCSDFVSEVDGVMQLRISPLRGPGLLFRLRQQEHYAGPGNRRFRLEPSPVFRRLARASRRTRGSLPARVPPARGETRRRRLAPSVRRHNQECGGSLPCASISTTKSILPLWNWIEIRGGRTGKGAKFAAVGSEKRRAQISFLAQEIFELM
jgi:hypothetical protein